MDPKGIAVALEALREEEEGPPPPATQNMPPSITGGGVSIEGLLEDDPIIPDGDETDHLERPQITL